MGRYSSNPSTGHRVQELMFDCYRISWTVDRYYSGDRLRYPTRYSRDTDTTGMLRFCAKWDIETPEDKRLRLFKEKHS
jgi:hypothetical protein